MNVIPLEKDAEMRCLYAAAPYDDVVILKQMRKERRRIAVKRRLRTLSFLVALVVTCAGAWVAGSEDVPMQTFCLIAFGVCLVLGVFLVVAKAIGKRQMASGETVNDLSCGSTRVCTSDELRELRDDVCYKPVIYLYPEKETRCNVRVGLQGTLTCTYPAHGADGWRNFVAVPDGTLTFPDGRKYYCLYWEGMTPTRWDFSKGYCVKGADTADFLAEVLAKIGLSFREANEFIIYWLPCMQDNPYNVIAFQNEIYTLSAKLEIEPQPDSILRVFMAWKASDHLVDIPAPEIKPFERKGFTVVEWGGTEVGK